MTDLDPCLLGCDSALAEADLLIAMLEAGPESVEHELSAVRTRIVQLRREVDRLRGLPIVPTRRNPYPEWSELAGAGLPWPRRSDSGIDV